MMSDKLVTYEVAKLAKEKGFDGRSFYVYNNEKILLGVKGVVNWHKVEFIAPTQSLLQRWLREEKGVAICVDIFDDGWFFDISTFQKQDTGVYEVDIPYKSSNVSPVYDTYELALENALKYSLENLV